MSPHSTETAVPEAPSITWRDVPVDVRLDPRALSAPPTAQALPPVFGRAGDAAVRALIWRHHSLLRRHPALAGRLPADSRAFSAFTQSVIEAAQAALAPSADTLVPVPRVALTLHATARVAWRVALQQAFVDTAFPPAYRASFWDWAETLLVPEDGAPAASASLDELAAWPMRLATWARCTRLG